MHASDVWMIFITLALVMYVVLDGYDLGIGVFTLLERDDRSRQEMHALVERAWDGNESWIVLLAGATFAGGPLSFLHGGYAVLTGLTATALYMLAGAAWMYLKFDGDLQQGTGRAGRSLTIVLGVAVAACWALLPAAGTTTPVATGP